MNRFLLPGFGLPLNFKPREATHGAGALGEGKDLFPNALDPLDLTTRRTALDLTTLRELTMLQLMNHLTDKPGWHNKASIFDEKIVRNLKSEALAAEGRDVTERMIDWCVEELRWKANSFQQTGIVSVYDAGVVKSDTAIPPYLKSSLRNAVRALEDLPDTLKDWHPGSDGKVLDLVHPSLYPLIYGRSRILENETVTTNDSLNRSGEGITIPVPPSSETILEGAQVSLSEIQPGAKPFSKHFQWLPCDVQLLDSDVRITSYINNLHPFKHEELYWIIEQIIACTIPLWNQTLTAVKSQHPKLNRIVYTSCEYDPDPENGPEEDGPQQEDGEDRYAFWRRRRQWYRDTRTVVQPEPGVFKPPGIPKHLKKQYIDEATDDLRAEHVVNIFRDYRSRGIQVIVKLANIHLTPEKPHYPGGIWHVEGQSNEHICASAVYYYDSENITTTRLSFRQQVRSDSPRISYPQDHHDWLTDVFGCQQHGPCIQELGSVVTSENRLLTWPNILQHRVQPFKLADPTKPGHRKILALFLVDPHIRIISTANVPSQRADWWAETVQDGASKVSKLPAELQTQIFEGVENFPISLEDAKDLRTRLMDERRSFVADMDQAFQQHEFSLCEH